jgi:hypothetical protein
MPSIRDDPNPTGSLKHRLRRELFEYAVNVAYLTLVFAAFTQ